MMDEIKIVESIFTEKEIEVIKATILGGGWGDADFELANGQTVFGFGYPTSDAKIFVKSITKAQIAGHYSSIASKIIRFNLSFMQHIADYWDEGKTGDGMLFIKDDVYQKFEDWAKTLKK